MNWLLLAPLRGRYGEKTFSKVLVKSDGYIWMPRFYLRVKSRRALVSVFIL